MFTSGPLRTGEVAPPPVGATPQQHGMVKVSGYG